MAVIKANAYGHGVITAARALAEADAFALAMTAEALQLRAAGFEQRLLVLQGFQNSDELAQLAEHQIATVVTTKASSRCLKNTPAQSWMSG